MKCPFCGYEESRVLDSRPADDNRRIRRRRECLSCKQRFNTFEAIESSPIIIIKKDGSRQLFDRDKVIRSMVKACEKRPISLDTLDAAANDIEQTLLGSLDREVQSVRVGELVMDKLKSIDQVAYVRFASVYRQFSDVNSFMNELKSLIKEQNKE